MSCVVRAPLLTLHAVTEQVFKGKTMKTFKMATEGHGAKLGCESRVLCDFTGHIPMRPAQPNEETGKSIARLSGN